MDALGDVRNQGKVRHQILTGEVSATFRVDGLADGSARHRSIPRFNLFVHGLSTRGAQNTGVQVSDLVEQRCVGARKERSDTRDTQFGSSGILNCVEGFGNASGVGTVVR